MTDPDGSAGGASDAPDSGAWITRRRAPVWVDRVHRIAVLEVPVQWHVVYSVWFWMTDEQWARFRADPVAFAKETDVHAHDHGRAKCKAWLLWDEGPADSNPLPTTPRPLASM
jgi:hypothetical protein